MKNSVLFDFDNFGEAADKPKTKRKFHTNPLALLICLRETLQDHDAINAMRTMSYDSDPQSRGYWDTLSAVKESGQRVQPCHIREADQIMEYYGIKYSTIRLSGMSALSSYQQCVMDLKRRFQNQEFEITDLEQRALWKLMDFYKMDTHVEQVLEQSVSAQEPIWDKQELDLRVHSSYLVKQNKKAVRRAEVFLAKTEHNQIVMMEVPEQSPEAAFMRYVFKHQSGFRVGVRKSRITRIIPNTDFNVIVLADYEVLKLY